MSGRERKRGAVIRSPVRSRSESQATGRCSASTQVPQPVSSPLRSAATLASAVVFDEGLSPVHAGSMGLLLVGVVLLQARVGPRSAP